MAKRSQTSKLQRKVKTEAEMEQIEADRVAAHAVIGANVQVTEFDDHSEELSPEDVALNEMAEEVFDEVGEATALTESEEGDEERVVNSIVKPKFKDKYAANAAAIGDTRKQVKRSNWDWLSQQLATFCLNDKGKIDIGAFTDVLDANGVDHSRWTNRNKGWEGRFRMTGRVALQKVVANTGILKWPSGLDDSVAPAEFVERYKTKA